MRPAPAAEINAGPGMPGRGSPSPTGVHPSAAAPAARAGSEPPRSSPGPDPRVPALLPRGWGDAQGREKAPRFHSGSLRRVPAAAAPSSPHGCPAPRSALLRSAGEQKPLAGPRQPLRAPAAVPDGTPAHHPRHPNAAAGGHRDLPGDLQENGGGHCLRRPHELAQPLLIHRNDRYRYRY